MDRKAGQIISRGSRTRLVRISLRRASETGIQDGIPVSVLPSLRKSSELDGHGIALLTPRGPRNAVERQDGRVLCVFISRQTAYKRRSGTREAFVAAGVKEVIEARWRVNDAATLDQEPVLAYANSYPGLRSLRWHRSKNARLVAAKH
jgi:hypothetical protein